MLRVFIFTSLLLLGACASETAKMAHQVNNNFTNEFSDNNSDLCKKMLIKSEN